jgi:phosphoglycolate phosphatase
MPKLIERALPEDKRDSENIKTTLEIFMAHYREHFVDKTVAYDGIIDLLDSLSEYKMAVISNKVQEMATVVTEKLLGDRFSIVCGKREGYPTKPDPTLTLEIINELGVKPGECLFIGDSGMDMAVSKNAGCVGVGVLWGFREEDELRQNGADYIVSKPNEILSVLKEISNEK